MELLGLNEQEIQEQIKDFAPEKYRAKQIFVALNQGKTFDEITNINKETREKLNQNFVDQPIQILEKLEAKDGTIKFLYKLNDLNIIEGVLMKYKYGNTICVSTQVGCSMGCSFCASTLGGKVRDLTPAEILGQVVIVNKFLNGGLGEDRKITNIVLMGSGEPLDNYENVTKFIDLVTDKNGFNFSSRNISLSTCGIVDKIKKLADDGYKVILSLSLHAPTDEIRKKIMAVANRYKIEDVINACVYYSKKTNRRIIFEYILIDGINNTPECAEKLAKLLKGLNAHVNLIPLNPVKDKPLKSVTREQAFDFQAKLNELGVTATIRRSLGQDIEGACGQLRRKYLQTKTVE